MDAISEWNVENDRPTLDKWCVTGYDQYNLHIRNCIDLLYRDYLQYIDIISQSQGLYLHKGASKRGWTSWMVAAVDPR